METSETLLVITQDTYLTSRGKRKADPTFWYISQLCMYYVEKWRIAVQTHIRCAYYRWQ